MKIGLMVRYRRLCRKNYIFGLSLDIRMLGRRG
jgi:hypothetical protein